MNDSSWGASETVYVRGIRANLPQFIQQAIQVFFVGLVIGMERNVLPVLSRDFGVPKGSFLFLMSFVVSFGFVKGILNLVAGRLSEHIGRKKVLLLGWLAALPIPFLILHASSWGWIVLANVFLGINQGFAWTMTVTSKVDITRAEQRGFATGVNEFAGYAAVAIAGVVTAYLSVAYGPRDALFGFSLTVILVAILMALLFIKETLPWAKVEGTQHANGTYVGHKPRFAAGVSERPGTWEIFTLVSFRNRTFRSFAQAGITNKLADALLWVLFPIFLHNRGLSIVQVGWVTGVYGAVWGGSQLWTGALSDAVGRKKAIVAGLWVLGLGVSAVTLVEGTTAWVIAAAVMGVGMALLYPNLIAAVADISHPSWRSTALGVYRYWRDTGYAIGAIALGLVAQWRDEVAAAFWFTAAVLALSGLWVAMQAEETHPRFNPADPGS
ncbi:MAG TPA: MFS transporter [Burkholderiales bacterium]|nr:MFS transporter [Burkholderiales bacterium]